MKKRTTFAAITLLLGCLLVTGLAWADTSGTYSLDWDVIGGGGGSMSGSSNSLSGTVGQVAVGESTGAYRLGSGFWYGLLESSADLGYSIYLPAVLK